ncbi:MAG: tetratricopeptide repeat protein [Pseudomonadota bacterium]
MIPLAILLVTLASVDHPDPAGHPPHMRELLAQARERFEASASDSASAYGELGMIYQANDFLQPARQAFETAQELAPADARWPYYLGMQAAREGRFADAEAAFSQSLEVNPDYAPARVRLAQAHLAQGDGRRARKILEAVTVASPRLAAAHAELGQILLADRDFDAAVRYLEEALSLQPTASALRTPLAMAYRASGNADRAAELLSQRGTRDVVLLDPLNERLMSNSRSFNYFMSLGVAAAEAGDLAQGIRYLQTSRDIAPDNPNVQVTLARLLEVDGQLAPAMQAAEAALAARPDYPLALEQRGVLLEMTGDWQAAALLYERALELNPELSDARLLLANAQMRQGRFAEAAGQLELLSQQRPADPVVALRLAVSRAEAGDCAAAAQLLDQRLRSSARTDLLMVLARIVAGCEGSPPALAGPVLGALRQLYARQADLEITSTLAMLEMASGSADAAVAYQQEALFLALRDGLAEDEMAVLRASLERYRSGQSPERPWPAGHPVTAPPLARPGDR